MRKLHFDRNPEMPNQIRMRPSTSYVASTVSIGFSILDLTPGRAAIWNVQKNDSSGSESLTSPSIKVNEDDFSPTKGFLISFFENAVQSILQLQT